MNRRHFLAFTAASYQRIRGANDRLGIALIGSGRRGRDVMAAMLATGLYDLKVVCDIYDVQRDRALTALTKGDKPFQCAAHEEALARPGVDTVLIGSPDHHHLTQARAAFAAGKHVYLEKPATHLHTEGPHLLKAARLSGKVCQVGTQQRSGAHYRRVKQEFFDSGKLGRIVNVRTWWSNFPWQARRIQPAPKPAGLDWLRFLGDTPYRDYDPARYDAWRYFPEYGGGVLADILNHWADVAQWMMNDASPRAAVSLGGIYELADGRANPDTVNAIVQYKNWNLSFESSVLSLRDDRPGVLFQGTQGSLFLARDGYIHSPTTGAPTEIKATENLEQAHARDFHQAIRDNRRPSADIALALEGLRPCHLARAAYWSQKRATYDAGRDRIMVD